MNSMEKQLNLVINKLNKHPLISLSIEGLRLYFDYKLENLIKDKKVFTRNELDYLLSETGPGNRRINPQIISEMTHNDVFTCPPYSDIPEFKSLAYTKSPDEMKRLFLGLYWERFEVADKKIQTVIPSPIIRDLMQAEDLVFTKKYKEVAGPRIITDLAVNFTPFIAGKSKSKIAPKTQKSRHKVETFEVEFNKPSAVILDTVWGGYRGLNPN